MDRAMHLRRTVRRRCSGRELRAMAVEFPEVDGHPNRLPFEGCLTLVDIPSDKAPSGARGHRVVLTKEAAEMALPSLLGMAVDYKAGWDGHDARQKCGIITSAHLEGTQAIGRRVSCLHEIIRRWRPRLSGAGAEINTHGHELRVGRCACRGYEGCGVAADSCDIYRSRNSVA